MKKLGTAAMAHKIMQESVRLQCLAHLLMKDTGHPDLSHFPDALKERANDVYSGEDEISWKTLYPLPTE